MAHQDDMNWLREEKLIVRLQGKEFVLYAGLIALAHRHGLRSIRTDMIAESDDFALCKATVEGKDGMLFEGYGDASTKSVSNMILPHLRRMAETRAKARALRDFTATGMCSLEELGGSTKEAKPADPKKVDPAKRKPKCSVCGSTEHNARKCPDRNIQDGPAKPKPKPKPKVELAPEPVAPSSEAMVETQPAGKNGKHPSWAGEHKSWIFQVNELGWSYDEVAKLAEDDGHLRPSQMDTAQRRTLLSFLEDKVNRRWDGE